MKKINLAITGCMGRMGQQIIKSARSDKNFAITVITENRLIKKKIIRALKKTFFGWISKVSWTLVNFRNFFLNFN